MFLFIIISRHVFCEQTLVPVHILVSITSGSTVTYPSRYHYGAPDSRRLFTSEEPKMVTQEIGKFFLFFFPNEEVKGFVNTVCTFKKISPVSR